MKVFTGIGLGIAGVMLINFLFFAFSFWIFMSVLGFFGIHWSLYVSHPWIATLIGSLIWSVISGLLSR